MVDSTTPQDPQERYSAVRVAWMSLAAAALFFLGRVMPYMGVGGESESLADGGESLSVLFVGGPLVVAIAAVAALVNTPRAAWVAAGAACALVGPTLWMVGDVSQWVTSYNQGGWDERASLKIGAVVHVIAILLALAAGLVAAANHASWEGTQTQPPARAFMAASFLAFPAAVLLEHDNWSVWDIESGLVQFAALVWGLGPVAVAAWVALQGRVKGVLLALGVGIGSLVVGFGMKQDGGRVAIDGEMNESPYLVPGVDWFVIGAVVVVGLGLVCLTQMGIFASATAQGSSVPTAQPPVGAATIPPPPGSVISARWAADPFGRFEFRYYDGGAWTAIVSTGGVVSNDPPIPPPPA